MVSVMLYVEGGGNSKSSERACRRAFGRFVEKAGIAAGATGIVACGSRGNAYRLFRAAHAAGEFALLLVDAERPVTAGNPWDHLNAPPDNWDRPAGATDQQCHLMVQVTESWFLADIATLVSFYGQGFRSQTLHTNPNIEDVPKLDVVNRLIQATRQTQKGPYNKGKHSFEILENIDPAKVMAASP